MRVNNSVTDCYLYVHITTLVPFNHESILLILFIHENIELIFIYICLFHECYTPMRFVARDEMALN